MTTQYHVGDYVVFHKHKFSPRPGPNACDIAPTPHGEDCSYCVDKFWRVVRIGPGDAVVVRTRRGKVHMVSALDPALRKAHGWECLLFRGDGRAAGLTRVRVSFTPVGRWTRSLPPMETRS